MKNPRAFAQYLAGIKFEFEAGETLQFVFRYDVDGYYHIEVLDTITHEIKRTRLSNELGTNGYSFKACVTAAFETAGTGIFANLLDTQAHELLGRKASSLLMDPNIDVKYGSGMYIRDRKEDKYPLGPIEMDVLNAIVEYYTTGKGKAA